MNCHVKMSYIPNRYLGWWIEAKRRKGPVGSHTLMKSQFKEGIIINIS